MTKPARRVPRGIRNNNPCNIRVGQNWQGEMARAMMTSEQAAETAFEVFATMPDGIRAAHRILLNYQTAHGLNTIRGIITRWAPPNENDTEAYIKFVSERVGVGSGVPVDLREHAVAFPFVRSMCIMECGEAPADADINAGLFKNGVHLDDRPLSSTRTVKGAQLAAGSTVLGGVAEALRDVDVSALSGVKAQLAELLPYLPYAKWGIVALTLVGLASVVYARWDDRRQGVR